MQQPDATSAIKAPWLVQVPSPWQIRRRVPSVVGTWTLWGALAIVKTARRPMYRTWRCTCSCCHVRVCVSHQSHTSCRGVKFIGTLGSSEPGSAGAGATSQGAGPSRKGSVSFGHCTSQPARAVAAACATPGCDCHLPRHVGPVARRHTLVGHGSIIEGSAGTDRPGTSSQSQPTVCS